MKQQLYSDGEIRSEIDTLCYDLGRYPTTREIDECKKLPSSRHIQRRYGSIQSFIKPLEKTWGDINRSKLAKRTGEESKTQEREMHMILRSIYGERNVHEQPRLHIKNKNYRADFKVYRSDTDFFYIDCFLASTKESCQNSLNHKKRKYGDLKIDYVWDFSEKLYKEDKYCYMESDPWEIDGAYWFHEYKELYHFI